MARKKTVVTVDLVEESHKAVSEIAAARQQFSAGKIGSDQALAHIGLFNATSRVLGTAINAERWKQSQERRED